MTMQVQIEIKWARCFQCNRWHAYELTGCGERACGYCASERADSLSDMVQRQDKTIAALRGAITRARNRRKA